LLSKLASFTKKDWVTKYHRILPHTCAAVKIFFRRSFRDLRRTLYTPEYGHNIGDGFLTKFSDVLKKNFSENGIISRFGGDEFVVLTDMPSVDEVKERGRNGYLWYMDLPEANSR